MGRRIALLSGGKDSLYAAIKRGGVDLGLFLVYNTPIPSPHLLNMGKSLETLSLTGIPVLVVYLPPGKEYDRTVDVLRHLETDELVCGDVYVEDHMRYFEKVASDAGASLSEPLWGLDTEELMYRIVEQGITGLFTSVRGVDHCSILGSTYTEDNVSRLVDCFHKHGIDPLGERGEYHTMVLDSPLHHKPLQYRIVDKLSVGEENLILLV